VCVADVTHVVSWLIASRTGSPIEGGTDVSEGQPKFDAVRSVDQRVLGAFQSTIIQQKTGGKPTLIIVRITLTELKRALAGAILESSFARFEVSMAAFNADIAPSRPLGRWGSTSMDKIRGGRERIVQRGGCGEGLGP